MKPTMTGGGLGLSGLGTLASARRRRSADVVVVGAGISGLVAAQRIAASGRSVVVLEARQRVGGRVESGRYDDLPLDLGGACVGATHHRLRRLIEELGMSTWPAYDEGTRVSVDSWPGWGFPTRVRRHQHRADIEKVKRRVDAVAAAVDPSAPWDAPADLDAQSLGSWVDGGLRGERARVTVRNILENVLSADPDGLSLLQGLLYVRAGGGSVDALLRKTGGAQQDLVVGGSHSVAQALADGLGDAVVLGEAVRRIAQSGGRVVAETDGLEVEAATAVVALPPLLASRIEFEPGLSAERSQLMRSLRPGDSIKAVAVYDDAFWRHDGRGGEAWGTSVPFSFTHDVSCREGEPGVMSVFFAGSRAAAFRQLTPDARRDATLSALEACFGPHAAHPVHYAERDWTADEWSQGGYGVAMPVGGWSECGHVLREPCGLVHWAGTETATEHQGYIEGAVQAGQRAAAEVLRAEARSVA
jgi:monoamine oxidase